MPYVFFVIYVRSVPYVFYVSPKPYVLLQNYRESSVNKLRHLTLNSKRFFNRPHKPYFSVFAPSVQGQRIYCRGKVPVEGKRKLLLQ